MDTRSLKRLEYDKVLALLSAKALSAPGKEMALNLKPQTDLWMIERAQTETEEAFHRLIKQGEPPIGGLRDISELLKAAQKGVVLSMGELLMIADTSRSIRQAREYGTSDEEHAPTPRLDELFGSLADYGRTEREIERCILSEEEMDDHASETLYSIRRDILAANQKVRSELNSMIHSASMQSALQDPIITIRGGRYCLPVKSEARGAVKGMIHDQSSSGSTVFVEPMAVVMLNNRVAELQLREKEEMNRILQKLTGMVGADAIQMNKDLETMILLDFIFAKGKLAVDQNAVRPKFSKENLINLPRARHPLIDPDKVVPISIRLGGSFTTLVITGPNTGGKTVSLKTLGLLTLMGQSGLHVPASAGCCLMVPDQVFADIGDEQSIEQSLSTFSAHMVNIAYILKEVTPNSLVLFDELGAGTDPVEGAALANAILENLRNRSILTAATTHYSELKIYALSTEKVENASCEFDVETLKPTYRLMIGVPGKSNAFAISERLGLDSSIIQNARELMQGNDIKFEEMMTELEERRKQAEEEQNRIIELRREISDLQSKAKQEQEKIAGRENKILMEARAEAREILQKAKAEADSIIQDMNKAIRNGAAVNMRSLEENRARLRKGANQMDEEIRNAASTKKASISLKDLKKGVKVHLSTLDADCIVVEEPDEKGSLVVRAGILQMHVKAADIDRIVPEDDLFNGKSAAPSRQKSTSLNKTIAAARKFENKEYDHGVMGGSFGKASSVQTQVDLRGMNAEEALDKLDKYLDDAWLAGLERVSVVHGKGTGVLRTRVQQFLRKRAHVVTYRLGSYGEGDSGVTIVELSK